MIPPAHQAANVRQRNSRVPGPPHGLMARDNDCRSTRVSDDCGCWDAVFCRDLRNDFSAEFPAHRDCIARGKRRMRQGVYNSFEARKACRQGRNRCVCCVIFFSHFALYVGLGLRRGTTRVIQDPAMHLIAHPTGLPPVKQGPGQSPGPSRILFFIIPFTYGEYSPVLDLQYSINPFAFRFSLCVPHLRFSGLLSLAFSFRCRTTARLNGAGP